MQTTQQISAERLGELVAAIYAQGDPVIKEAYSQPDQALRTFPYAEDLLADLATAKQRTTLQYTIYYPAAGGNIFERRIGLKPGALPGFTHRFASEGWGLIGFQCEFMEVPMVKSRIAVNKKARAVIWSSTRPELGDPECWNWEHVERHAGRLIRLLRKLGKDIPGSDG